MIKFLLPLLISFNILSAQTDSVLNQIAKDPHYIDSLNLIVSKIVITGNDITKDEIILREMSLKKRTKLTYDKYQNDLLRIYNLKLFTKVEILPIPEDAHNVMINVNVQERWYIWPLPAAGIEDGEWAKKWIGLNIRWDNFRGRNETISAGFKILYNPYVRVSYSVPWIGEKIHLYSSISASYSKTRNKSLLVLGHSNGTGTLTANDSNYDNIQYKANIEIGKFLTHNFAVFGYIGYDFLRVSQWAPGRTVSTTGVDKYLTYGPGVKYDSRDVIEFATKGYYLRMNYLRYGHLDETINFGRFNFEGQSFIPVNLSKKYYITIASKVFTSLATGAVIPVYQHEYLGYSEDYVRGWKKVAFEGEDVFTVYNELRIPIVQPAYTKGKDVPLMKDIKMLRKVNLKYGLYLTILYDIGTVWNKGQYLSKLHFLQGTGIGLNFILPLGYVARAEWAFRLGKPIKGQLNLALSAKF